MFYQVEDDSRLGMFLPVEVASVKFKMFALFVLFEVEVASVKFKMFALFVLFEGARKQNQSIV